jgi:succinoglycan biosynthesis transport protein ExoP
MSLEVQTKPQVLPPAESRIPTLISTGDKLTLMEVWRVLMKRRFVIIAVTILSLAGALWYALRTAPVYESVARIEIQPQQTANIGIEQLIEEKTQSAPQNELQTEVSILQSDSVLFDTAQSLNLQEGIRSAEAALARKKGFTPPPANAPISPTERQAMIDLIRSGLSAKILNGTNLVEIRYRSRDPKLGAAIVNRLVETYSDEDLRTKFERTMHVSSWLQKQLEGLKTEASDAQQKLADYQKAHNIVGTDDNSNLTLQTLQNISSALDDAESDRIMKEVRMRDFDSLKPEEVGVLSNDPNLAALRSHLQDLETQRAQTATRFGVKHPKMIDLQSQIKNVQAQITSEIGLARHQVRDDFQSAAGVESALRKRLQEQEEAAYKLNEGAAQFIELAFAKVGRTIKWEGEGVGELGIDSSSRETLVQIDPRYFRPTEVDLLLGDPSKARRELGWHHRVTFPELVSEMMDSDLETIAKEYQLSERSYEQV